MSERRLKVALVEPRGCRLNIFALAKMARGIALLATILDKLGYEVIGLVETLQSFNWRELLDYDVICISTITCTTDRAYHLIRKLRRAGYDKPIILGGPHASACREEGINAGADAVIGHEGERGLPELVEAIAQKKSWAGVLGLTWMTEAGQIIHNPDRPFLTCAELSELPYLNFRLIRGYEKMPQVALLPMSRGCPFTKLCEFCAVGPMFGPGYRHATLEWCKGQLIAYRQEYPELWATKKIFFVDDNLLGGPEGKRIAKAFLEWMIAEDMCPPMGFLWQMTPKDATPETCERLKRAGGDTACLGVESVDSVALKAMNKPQDPEEVLEGLRNLHDAGIKTLAMTIAGTDEDTFWSIRASNRRLLREGKITFLMISFLTPLPGTKMTWRFIRSGRPFSSKRWRFNGLFVVHKPLKMTKFGLWLALWSNMAWFYFGTSHGWGLIWPQRKAALRMLGVGIGHAVLAPLRFLIERFARH